jgi:hypothetical protein
MLEVYRSMLTGVLIPDAYSDYLPPSTRTMFGRNNINSLGSYGTVHWRKKAMTRKIAVVTGAGRGIGRAATHGSMAVEPTRDVQNVGEAVAFMASFPLDANVMDLTVMATKMPFAGRG